MPSTLARNLPGRTLGIHSVLFRVWLADASVLDLALLGDVTRFTAFRTSAFIVRFHGYAGGAQAGVYVMLRTFALPPTATTVADLISVAVRVIRDSETRALLNVFLQNIHTKTLHGMGAVDFRVCRHSMVNGRRERTRVQLFIYS